MTKTSEIATKTEQINLTNPNDIMNFATNLKELVVQNHLYTEIQHKNYVNVEGWQIAGAFMGIFPVVDKVEDLSEGNTYRYRAEVSLYDSSERLVGRGVAICTNKERGKTGFDEYAVASMAQTRAVGKAFRMKIGWLLKVAGYETTPAEEMDAVVQEATVVERPTPKPSPVPTDPPAEEPTPSSKQLGWLKNHYFKAGMSEEQVTIELGKLKTMKQASAEISRLVGKR